MVYVNQWLIILIIFIAFCIGVWLGMGYGEAESFHEMEALRFKNEQLRVTIKNLKRQYWEACNVSNKTK